MAQSLKKAPNPLVSQVLPTVKCSTCNKPVPVHQLGDHACTPASPVSPFRSPMHSQQSAAALLPARFQNLPNAPPPSRSPIPIPPSSPKSPKFQDRPPLAVGYVPSNLNPAPRQLADVRVRNPLARSDFDQPPSSVHANTFQERMKTPSAPQRDFTPERREMDRRMYSPQSRSTPSPAPLASYVPSNPPPLQNSMAPPPARPSNMMPPPSPTVRRTPTLEDSIDTKTGGEAGMAGVGRRGFAAAALAMSIAPYGLPSQNVDHPHSGMNGRANSTPRYLDVDTSRSRTAGTPPLSPNSNSSQSLSPGPHSPQQFVGNDRNQIVSRSPSPSQFPYVEKNLISASRAPPSFPPDVPKTPETPLSSALSAKLPFFEKFKNKLPGSNPETRSPLAVNFTSSVKAPPPPSPRLSESRLPAGSESRNPTPRPEIRRADEAQPINHKRTVAKFDPPNLSSNPNNNSEYGLGYIASTDKPDDEKARSLSLKTRQKKAPPPPLNLPELPSQVKSSLLSSKNPEPRAQKLEESSSDMNNHKRPSDGRTDTTSVYPKGLSAIQEAPQQYRAMPNDHEANDKIFSASSMRTESTGSNSIYSISTGTGTGLGGLSRTMETLLEDIANETGPRSALGSGLFTGGSSLVKSKPASALGSPTSSVIPGSKAQRSYSVHSPESSKSHKLPARSATHRTTLNSPKPNGNTEERPIRSSKDRPTESRRTCMKCRTSLADKLWVPMDSGGVLCERCWKNMYLPKCRRCNISIEKQAVSSSDGQLKGKYHPQCFNCDKCHKPFPDKSFYVFDGKPLCAYHYHEANNSLCAARSCGQPIEGPCAVSHSGERYHPEHFLCEYAGSPKCRERLAEYWEIDGRMLCERHAIAASRPSSNDSDDDRRSWTPNSRATKRVTRFIDLAGSGLR